MGGVRVRDGQQDGFSLIELMVVLGIVALMAAIAIPAISNRLREPDLRQLTKELTAQLRVAHTLAVATGKPQRIDFNPETRMVHFANGKQRIFPSGTTMTLTTRLETISSDRDATLTFLPNGSSSGMVVDLTLGNRKSRVEINWLTGAVALMEPQ